MGPPRADLKRDSQAAYDADRPRRIQEMYVRYSGQGSRTRLLRLWWKRNAWFAVTRGSRLLKRAIDIVGAVSALILLSPAFAAVAVCSACCLVIFAWASRAA